MQSEAAGRVTEVPGIEVAGEVAGEAAGEVAEEAVNDTACGAGEGKDEELQFKEDEQYMHKLVNQPASERVSDHVHKPRERKGSVAMIGGMIGSVHTSLAAHCPHALSMPHCPHIGSVHADFGTIKNLLHLQSRKDVAVNANRLRQKRKDRKRNDTRMSTAGSIKDKVMSNIKAVVHVA